MKLLLLITAFLILSNILLQGQNKIQGLVIDKATSEPLSYAVIGAIKQQYGSYTDTVGRFTLYYGKESDSLKISQLGYKSIFTTVGNLTNNPNILLEPNPVKINDVVLQSKRIKGKEREIGIFQKSPGVWEVPSYSVSIYATLIPFPKKGNTLIIQSVKFAYCKAPKNFPIRIRILKVQPNGKPGDDLISENIIFSDFKNGKALRNPIAIIDISKYNILIPQEGVFVGLEWIDFDRTPFTLKEFGKNGPYICAIRGGTSDNISYRSLYNQSIWLTDKRLNSCAIGLRVKDFGK